MESVRIKHELTYDDVCQLMMMFDGFSKPPNDLNVIAKLTTRKLVAHGKLTQKGRAVCAELAGIKILPEGIGA